MSGAERDPSGALQQASLPQLLRRMMPLLRPQRGQVAFAFGLIAIWTGKSQ